ncbi:MAG: polysaccharide deacetylase family protein [Proteobacteria bacterium]|nr:polysaccharide deacetylase family protein [Pseudomonadota bacterium]
MELSRKSLAGCLLVLTLVAVASVLYFKADQSAPAQKPTPQVAAVAVPVPAVPDFVPDLTELLASYRKIIVLIAEENKLAAKEREAANQAASALFHENQLRLAKLEEKLDGLQAANHPQRLSAFESVLNFVESAQGLYDADRLAFRELLETMRFGISRDGSLPAVKLHKRIGEDIDALTEIERNYDKEIRQIFSRFEARAIELKREKWEAYVAHLKTIYSSEQILKDFGVIVPYPQPKAEVRQEQAEMFGNSLPAKTLVLTFDDGPHPVYSEEISSILAQYGVPAVFFQVGRNIGSIGADGKTQLSSRAKISRKLVAGGNVLGNHSFTHAQLSKTSGDSLKAEITNTDLMLKAVSKDRANLFRFPYGARNSESMAALEALQLKSVMWNVDSLDWADPVPSSIADRVLRAIDKEGKGIVLFHDIHQRTIKALPLILDRLIAEGYQFATWDGSSFKVTKASAKTEEKSTITTGYADSWALVIGIDDYAKWPKLRYAVRDAESMRQVLIEKFGFAPERVISIKNAEATRTNILSAFHDKIVHGAVKKNDRVFVFYAGHGATRKLSSGRDLGYIVPVDSDPERFATDAIPMTELQNIAESIAAKHVLFIMDACYSGLGLTRGKGSTTFLRDNAKRIGRQMLTAGGADQLVADSGPNGHSIFSWTLLQALSGKADLNGDGLVTGTELAAYVAPAVAAVSHQTPAFGSLPGSEGGEFVLELANETEFLGAQTAQLSGEEIALNKQLDSARPAIPAARDNKPPPTETIEVKDLQGSKQKITTPPAVPTSSRMAAQRANDRGLQLYREKQYAEAEAQFTEALKLRPDFALAANNLGFVFFRQDKFVEAQRWFENTLRIDPSRAIAYLNLADAQEKSGDKDKARKSYQTYLELAPNGSGSAYARLQLEKIR